MGSRIQFRYLISMILLANVGTGLLLYSLSKIVKSHQGCDESSLPVCTEGVLDKRSFKYDSDSKHSPKTRIQMPHSSSCKLKRYGKPETIQCFDKLSTQGIREHDGGDDDGQIHVVFIGDSRIRQFYFQFLSMFPWQNVSRPMPQVTRHTDMSEIIPLLGNAVRVSYYWHPLLYDNITDNVISHWEKTESSNLPHYILIGITLHHMLEKYQKDQVYFEQSLKALSPILDRLSRRMRSRSNGGIVWMNQYPIVDVFKKPCGSKCKIHSEHIEHYNSLARDILLRGDSAIRVWDSLNPIMDDYIRSCQLNLRINPQYHLQQFYACLDYVHPGYVALNEATQLLFNDICNGVDVAFPDILQVDNR